MIDFTIDIVPDKVPIQPVDKYFGTPLSEWIERTPSRDSFSLDGDALKDFARRSIIALVERGAVPVRPSAEKDKFWEQQSQYGKSPEEVAENVLNEWQKSGRDPDTEGLQFALINYT